MLRRGDNVLVYTCADKAYEDFAPIYIAAMLEHSKDVVCEVGVEDVDSFRSSYSISLGMLEEKFGADRFLISEVPMFKDGSDIVPNTVRFLTKPSLSARYIYIGDIDIFCLDRDFYTQHLSFMSKMRLPYSNSVRPGTERLTGLHFSEYDSYYPIPEYSDLNVSWMNDEKVLFQLVKRRGLEIQNFEWFRPIHGIHVSPNRNPMPSINAAGKKVPGWGIEGYAEQYRSWSSTPFFSEFRQALSERVKLSLSKIDHVVY